jgi:hypothetical protein
MCDTTQGKTLCLAGSATGAQQTTTGLSFAKRLAIFGPSAGQNQARLRHRPAALPELRRPGAGDHRGDPAAGSDRQDPHPPWVGSLAAAPGTGERGGPRGPRGLRVRCRLRSARHPGGAPRAGAQAPQPGWQLRAVPASGCVYARMRSTGRLRVVQPPALGACFPLPGLLPPAGPCEGV